jgi:RND family efflux transporter MFP subunit
MKHKPLISTLFAVALLSSSVTPLRGAASGAADGANAGGVEKPEAGKTLYTCGMHPNVIQDHPGNCPICGMKLTPLRRASGDAAGPGAAGISTIIIDPVTIQNMAIRTMVLTNGPLRRTIRTVGSVTYNEAARADVTTKFDGWVERLYVDTTGAQVHRADPLFEVYSPELYTAQTEYLLALEGGGSTGSLLETARTKLKFWDISDEQIAELGRTRTPQKTLKILAPIDGFVTEKRVVEGQMVKPGMMLYRIADLGLVWVQAQIYEQDLPYLRLGQEAVVTLTYLPDRKFRGRVTYIYPDLDPKTRTAQVRMEFHNPGYFLKPGMFAAVELQSERSPSALLVPDMAVLRSGSKNTVFVALHGGKFEPRVVTLGARAENDMLEVLHGLQAGERIVTSGQFMLDSESQLREAIQKMMEPAAVPAAAGSADSASTSLDAGGAHQHSLPRPSGELTYICPMPEHVAIEYEQAGQCPLCGMALVPVPADSLKLINPGGTVEYYTCPMPEHSEIRRDKPGKCPKCGMTLIPVMTPPPTHPSDDAATEQATPMPMLYTCPMAICQTVSDQPGRCSKCNMKLVRTGTVEHGPQMEEQWRQQHPHH